MKPIESIWNHFSEDTDYPSLQQDITTEVAIIGGGITGVTTGKLLARAGIPSVILESNTIGSGTTSYSTGNLYYTIDGNLSSLENKYDNDMVRAVTSSRSEVMQQMRRWIEDLSLDCDYKKVPWHLYSSNKQNLDTVKKELQTGARAKLAITEADHKNFPFPVTGAVSIDAQAQINPKRYVQELAATIKNKNCRIYQQTRVASIKQRDGKYRLQTPGGMVTANHVVHATHTPKGGKFVQTLLGPYREYGIACKTSDTTHHEGIYWGLYNEGTVISSRTYHKNGQTFLIFVGKPHTVGHKENNEQTISSLEDFAYTHFDIQETVFRWGGQHYRPADLLPFIGPVKKGAKEYIAAGYSTDGLVYGSLAAHILADQISGKEHQWTRLYDAARKQPLKSGSKFLKENIDVASKYIRDITVPKDISVQHVEAGRGRI